MRELSDKQQKAISLLAGGMRLIDIAKTLKVTDRTLRNWRNLPEFVTRLNQLEHDNYDAAISRLRDASRLAADNLIEICNNPGNPPQVRCRACESVLNFAKPTSPDEDLMKAIAAFAKMGVLPISTAEKLDKSGQVFIQDMKEVLKQGFNNE